jgi:hypothetical protein
MTEYDPRTGRPLDGPQHANPAPFAPASPEPDDDKPEFTDEHIAAATRAYANGKVIVLDRGPSEPKEAEPTIKGERTDAEIEADNRATVLAKREHDEWHKKHKEPVAVQMDKIDADHAVNSDPKRYVHVPRGLRAPVTIEERLAKIEQRLGPETPEEIEHRRERDEKLATERADRAKARAEKAK